MRPDEMGAQLPPASPTRNAGAGAPDARMLRLHRNCSGTVGGRLHRSAADPAGDAGLGVLAMEMAFTAVFQKVPEGYIAFVEELPGANTQGATLEEAARTCGRPWSS